MNLTKRRIGTQGFAKRIETGRRKVEQVDDKLISALIGGVVTLILTLVIQALTFLLFSAWPQHVAIISSYADLQERDAIDDEISDRAENVFDEVNRHQGKRREARDILKGNSFKDHLEFEKVLAQWQETRMDRGKVQGLIDSGDMSGTPAQALSEDLDKEAELWTYIVKGENMRDQDYFRMVGEELAGSQRVTTAYGGWVQHLKTRNQRQKNEIDKVTERSSELTAKEIASLICLFFAIWMQHKFGPRIIRYLSTPTGERIERTDNRG